MRMRYSLAIALTALLVLPGLLFAQSSPATAKPAAISVTLVYHENNSGNFDIKDETGQSVATVNDGDELKVGWTVLTGPGDVAELKMNHTSTIIKVAGNTNFKLEKLRTESGGQDVFSMAIGKVRTVAGKASTKDQYRILTQSAVCGVRGSDVVIETLDGVNAKLTTLEGTGFLQKVAGDTLGEALDVAQGFGADTSAPDFKVFQVPVDILQGLQNDMKFTKLDVNQTMEVNKAYQASQTPGSTGSQGSTTQNPTTPPAPQTNSTMDNILTALRDILGFEIGSINVPGPNGTTLTYAQAVFQPTFSVGKLKMALYLPIIYQGDMFNTSDWYRPAGNDEWSFGRDQTGFANQAADFTRDLLLKIKYVEYGRQRDPFFLKAGNLDDITIGHGLVMRNFANDADFPAVRHMGLNIGVDGPGGGFEAMVNDIAPDIVNGTLYPPDIMGGRLYFRPIPGFRAALGVSAVVDLNPARDFVDPANPGATGPNAAGNPIFINPGVDLDLPFVESDALGLIFFTDGALMIPYFRTVPTDPAYSGITTGFATKAFLDTSAKMPFKNWGAAAGFLGNLVIPDFTYRLQYQLYTGAFRPQFYDSAYEHNRGALVLSTLDYLTNSLATDQTYNMGIYGEAGLKLNKLFALNVGYFWPWSFTNGTVTSDPSTDHFIASFEIEKGVIPIVNLWGSVSYERTGFVETLQTTGLSGALFDANTVVSAQVNYPVSPIMDVSLIYSVVAARDGNGNLVYSAGSILPGDEHVVVHRDADSPVGGRRCQKVSLGPGGSGSSGTRFPARSRPARSSTGRFPLYGSSWTTRSTPGPAPWTCTSRRAAWRGSVSSTTARG